MNRVGVLDASLSPTIGNYRTESGLSPVAIVALVLPTKLYCTNLVRAARLERALAGSKPTFLPIERHPNRKCVLHKLGVAGWTRTTMTRLSSVRPAIGRQQHRKLRPFSVGHTTSSGRCRHHFSGKQPSRCCYSRLLPRELVLDKQTDKASGA